MNPVELARFGALQQELEWRRCAMDPAYFFSTYVKTVDKTSPTGWSLFEMTDYQREDLEAFENHSEILILKARQLGISTLTAAYTLWKMVTKPGFNVLTTSKSDVAAQNNNAKLTLAYHALPAWMKDRFVIESETTSTFRIRHKATGLTSKMLSVAATETVGASDTYDLAILDEFALSNYQEKTYGTIKPAVAIAATMKKSAAMIILSTARGSHNTFAQMYRAAMRGESTFHAIFHPWHASPWMTQEKYDAEADLFAAQGKPWEVYSEYPESPEQAFRESGSPLFRDLPPLEALSDFEWRGNIIELEVDEYGDRQFAFAEDPQGPFRCDIDLVKDDAFYVILADSSRGEGGDYQTAHVLTIDDDDPDERPQIVGYYHANDVPGEEFADDLDRIGRFYAGRQHAALLGVENQGGYGQVVINRLHRELDYPNPYVYTQVGKRSQSRIAGSPFSFPMSRNVREAILDRLREYLAPLNRGTVEVPIPKIKGLYPLLRAELGSFVKQVTPAGQVKYAADTGTHDDLVLSLAMSLWALLESYQGPDAQESTRDEEDQWQQFMAMRQRSLERVAQPQDREELIYL